MALATSAVAAVLLSACSSPKTSAAATTSDHIVVAVPALAPNFAGPEGGAGSTASSIEMYANTQGYLIRNKYVKDTVAGTYRQNFAAYSGTLAKSYSVSSDGLTYTFHLRTDVKSQAGNPLTADDVMWSFERKWKAPNSSAGAFAPSSLLDLSKQMKEIDAHTVSFTILKPSLGQSLLATLANLAGAVYDSTLLKSKATAADPYAINWSETHSGWGFGAYQVKSVTPDQEMVLQASKNYALGAAKISTVTLRVVPDAGTRAALVKSGEVNLAEATLPTDQATLKGSGVTIPATKDPIEYLETDLVNNKAPFNNEAVRQAFAFAVPYDQIRSQIYAGRATAVKGIVNPATKNYVTKDLPSSTYDPAKAKKMLAAAGFSSGVAFTLTVSSDVPDVIDAATLLKSYAAKAGFDVTINRVAPAEFVQGRFSAAYQAIILRNRAQNQTPTYALTFFWQPKSIFNTSQWISPEFTGLVNQGLEIRDPLSSKAAAYWEKAMAVEIKSAPVVYVAGVQPSQILAGDLKGFAYRADTSVDFWNLHF